MQMRLNKKTLAALAAATVAVTGVTVAGPAADAVTIHHYVGRAGSAAVNKPGDPDANGSLGGTVVIYNVPTQTYSFPNNHNVINSPAITANLMNGSPAAFTPLIPVHIYPPSATQPEPEMTFGGQNSLPYDNPLTMDMLIQGGTFDPNGPNKASNT